VIDNSSDEVAVQVPKSDSTRDDASTWEAVVVGDQLRRAFGQFPSGVSAVCVDIEGIPVGLAASSFTSVSMSPPLVSVCIQRSSTTWPTMRLRPGLGLSILAEDQEGVCRRLASRQGDRFADVDWFVTERGSLLIEGASLWLDCSLHEELPAGDHDIVLLRVHHVGTRDAPPLVFHGSRFRRLAPLGRP
jgi:flavin reductase (DIM6/NTAB) family NADH-FMN oxidoreductase RutF